MFLRLFSGLLILFVVSVLILCWSWNASLIARLSACGISSPSYMGALNKTPTAIQELELNRQELLVGETKFELRGLESNKDFNITIDGQFLNVIYSRNVYKLEFQDANGKLHARESLEQFSYHEWLAAEKTTPETFFNKPWINFVSRSKAVDLIEKKTLYNQGSCYYSLSKSNVLMYIGADNKTTFINIHFFSDNGKFLLFNFRVIEDKDPSPILPLLLTILKPYWR